MSPEHLDTPVMEALKRPGWNDTFARAVLHADTTMRKYVWRGFRPKFRAENEITVGDKSATDFVLDAVERLLEGKRTYDRSRDLLSNLNSITDSLIWSEKKHSDRTGVVDHLGSTDDGVEAIDPISTAPTSDPTAAQELIRDELCEDQRQCFDEIRASFDGDNHMQQYLDALRERVFKRAEISLVTGLSVEKVDELRRKLVKNARRFFGVPDFETLQRSLQEGR